MEENKQTNGMAIAAMICGILSIVLTCFIPYLSWILAIGGIVLAAMSKKKGKSGMATAGLVCSIVALAIWVIVIILIVIAGVSIGMMGA